MQSKEHVALDFTKRMQRFFADTHDWRKESAIMQAVYDGHPTLRNKNSYNAIWERLNPHKQNKGKQRTPAHAPMASAYINYVCGTMLQDEKQLIAYASSDGIDPKAATMNKGLKYIEAETGRRDIKYDQLLSASVRGIGGTVASLDFTIDDSPFGYPVYEHKDDIFFDTGLKGVVDSDMISWCGYVDAMNRDALDDYIEREADNKLKNIAVGTDFRSFLLEHKNYENDSEIEFLYVYFWREYRKVYDVENPFFEMADAIEYIGQTYPDAMNLLADTIEKLQVDIAESHFTFDKDDYKEFADLMANIGFMTQGEFAIELQYSSRMGRAYYRAEFAKGRMLNISRSFTSQCHAMSFIACNYDKTLGYHYGLMRPLAYYQRMLSESMDNMLIHSGRAARGGTKVVTGSGVDAERFKKYLDNDEEVFFGDAAMAVNSITDPSTAQSTMQSVEVVLRMMPMSLGLQSNAFETLMSAQKTAEEVRHVKSMMASALFKFYSAMNKSTLTDGWVMRDLVYELAGNITGTQDVSFTLGGKEETFALSIKTLARNYSMRIIERAQTKDEQLADYSMLREVIRDTIQDPMVLLQIAPLLIDMSPADFDDKQKLIESIKPPQATPEQEQMAMEERIVALDIQRSTAILQGSLAMEAQAKSKQAVEQIQVDIAKKAGEIEYKQAQTTNTEAKTAETLAKIGMEAYNNVNSMTEARE
jgi:hypothetical protein